MTDNTFTVHGGRTMINNKSNWPDHLSVRMNRHDAWQTVETIMNQLREEKREVILCSSVGYLTEESE